MTREEYLLLFEKYLAGKATPEEVEIIMQYADDFPLTNVHPEEDEAYYKQIETRLINRLNQDIHPPQKSMWRHFNRGIAATVLVMLTATTVFILNKRSNENKVPAQSSLFVKEQVKPGSNKAILTLANGKTIVLNDVANQTILKTGNLTVKKQKDGVLQYQISASAQVVANTRAEYNTISTPVGGQYQVLLPDGSKVWLNAASSLRFPTAFNGNERRVELKGEGYFEVAKNKAMPFKVAFNDQVVEVLGTHFNIMAYEDEDASKTTLLEGLVRISQGNIKQLLVPGQQARSNGRANGFDIQNVDTQESIAWKEGMFLFRNDNIEHIMRQIARWYNVDVVYDGNMQNMVFGGRISRSKNISEVLKNLELTGTIHFKTEGRRVTVME